MALDIKLAQTPSFLRRLAAMCYDLVLLFGMLLLAVMILILPYGALIGEFPHQEPWHRFALQLYLLTIIALFYGFFWVRGGQTLGMRAWRMRLLRDDGGALAARDALLRLFWAAVWLAPLGAGLLWMLIDREGLTPYDRLSRTRLVMTRKA